MALTITLWTLAVLLSLAGLAGLVLPALPGAPLLFCGLLLAAWAEDFQYVSGVTLGILAFLALLTYLADIVAGAFGARQFGASNRAMIGAGAGALAGLFFGLPGILLGPFVGAMIGELTAQRSVGAASRAGVGATLGLVLGVASKLSLAFAMLGVFAIARWL